jgi:hypothetical protein
MRALTPREKLLVSGGSDSSGGEDWRDSGNLIYGDDGFSCYYVEDEQGLGQVYLWIPAMSAPAMIIYTFTNGWSNFQQQVGNVIQGATDWYYTVTGLPRP